MKLETLLFNNLTEKEIDDWKPFGLHYNVGRMRILWVSNHPDKDVEDILSSTTILGYWKEVIKLLKKERQYPKDAK